MVASLSKSVLHKGVLWSVKTGKGAGCTGWTTSEKSEKAQLLIAPVHWGRRVAHRLAETCQEREYDDWNWSKS